MNLLLGLFLTVKSPLTTEECFNCAAICYDAMVKPLLMLYVLLFWYLFCCPVFPDITIRFIVVSSHIPYCGHNGHRVCGTSAQLQKQFHLANTPKPHCTQLASRPSAKTHASANDYYMCLCTEHQQNTCHSPITHKYTLWIQTAGAELQMDNSSLC